MTLPAIQRIERLSFLLVALVTLLSFLFRDRDITLGAGLGGLLGTLNFYALRRMIQAIFQSSNPRKQAVLAVLLTLKFGLVGTTIYLFVKFLPINALALLVGISIVVVSIFIEGFRTIACKAAAQSE